MKHPLIRLTVLIAFAILIYICVQMYAYVFFRSELKTHNIPVMNGMSGAKITYARALAEYDPLLGLAGTDPQELRAHTQELQEIMKDVAALQNDSQEKKYLQNALYPFSFLYALAALEESRLGFIFSGSQQDYVRYAKALDTALDAGISDSTNLINAYTDLTSDMNELRILGFAGVMTSSSIAQSLSSIPSALQELKREARGRKRCVMGLVWVCPSITLPHIQAVVVSPVDTQEEQGSMLSVEVALLLRAAAATSSYERTFTPMRLNESVCLDTIPGPYSMEASTQFARRADIAHSTQEMYFIPTAKNKGPVPTFLRNTYQLQYLKINPFTFYYCPYLLNEVSVSRAVMKTSSLVQKYPDIENPFKPALTSGIPTEADAVGYINTVIQESLRTKFPEPYIRDAISTALMFSQKGAGLDSVLWQIVYIYRHDLALVANGSPLDVSAENLFLTHAATPSLYLFQQIGARSPYVTQTQADIGALRKQYSSLSSLRATIPLHEILRDVEMMAQIERAGK